MIYNRNMLSKQKCFTLIILTVSSYYVRLYIVIMYSLLLFLHKHNQIQFMPTTIYKQYQIVP